MATFRGSSYPNPTKMITFKTSDDKQVKVPVEIARMCGVVRAFYDGDLDRPEVENADPFPLLNVRSDIFVNIVIASKMLSELRSIYEAVEKERQELEEFFGQLSDKTIFDLVKAADYLEIEEVLDFVMPSFRKRFGLGDDKGVEFVYTAEAEAMIRSRAASARKATMATYGGSSDPNPTTMATFITSDRERFKVPVAIAMRFGMVKAFVDGELADDPELENTVWPLPNVSSYVLDIVVYACKKLLELLPKYDTVEKEREKFDGQFFGQHTNETIVEQVKAADYLEIEELLDFVMPSFRQIFGLGDNEGVEFVYTAEAEAILLGSAAWASEGASS